MKAERIYKNENHQTSIFYPCLVWCVCVCVVMYDCMLSVLVHFCCLFCIFSTYHNLESVPRAHDDVIFLLQEEGESNGQNFETGGISCIY